MNSLRDRVIKHRLAGFGPSSVSGHDVRRLKSLFSELGISRANVESARDSAYRESVSIQLRANASEFSGFTFGFMKIKRYRFIIYSQCAWIVRIWDKPQERDFGWLCIRDKGFLDILWNIDVAEVIRIAVQSVVNRDPSGLPYSSASDAIRGADKLNLKLHLNWRGWLLCIFLAIGLGATKIYRYGI